MDKRIGAQFFTIRDHLKTIEDFDASCKKIKDIGYKIVQISGTPLAAKEMRDVLDSYDLKVVTTHRNSVDFASNPEEIIEYNKILGCDLCGLGIMPRECATDEKKLDEFIVSINKFCELAKSENMYFGYHNHSMEFVKVGGKLIMDRLIEETDPEIFNFIADTFWIQNGGKNPADFIKKLGKRAMAVHFKDYTVSATEWNTKPPFFAEVGNGMLEWDEIIAACEEAGTKWALVEQDNFWIDNDPFKAMKVSYDFLKEKGFN